MTMQTQPPISARFASLEAAERASLQLRETGFEARVGVTGADHVVTLILPDAMAEDVSDDVADDRREAARAALEAAGGQVIAVAGSHAPRRVQPGFTDAAPGIVPDESPWRPSPPRPTRTRAAASPGRSNAPPRRSPEPPGSPDRSSRVFEGSSGPSPGPRSVSRMWQGKPFRVQRGLRGCAKPRRRSWR